MASRMDAFVGKTKRFIQSFGLFKRKGKSRQFLMGRLAKEGKLKPNQSFDIRLTFFFQFLKFMNHKKSRLTDLFRKMDKDNNGLIPREDFIDGIIKTSKFRNINETF